MKLLVIGNKQRTETYLPDHPLTKTVEIVVAERGTSDDDLIALAPDADFIMVDAISPVSAYVMQHLPNLKLIHSEGVAYNAIDIQAARALGITVCNNAGVNASGVAEQAILLMLACLRDAVQADASVRRGVQIETKETMMVNGIRELGECSVGFIGFGAIGKATAARLSTWGCPMYYHQRHRISSEEERLLGVGYLPLDELVRTCDIVSLYVPVTDETIHLVNFAFLNAMKPDAILINTARGEIIENEALVHALEQGEIAMAGLDTIAPEPVTSDNPLLTMSGAAMNRLVLSPHIAGVTRGTFYRAHRTIWENIERVINGETPVNVVS